MQNRLNNPKDLYILYKNISLYLHRIVSVVSFLSFCVFVRTGAYAFRCCQWGEDLLPLKRAYARAQVTLQDSQSFHPLFIWNDGCAANEHARPGHHSLIRLAWNDNNVNIAHTKMKRIHSIVGLCHTCELNQPFLRFSCPMLAFKRCDRMSECDSFFFCFLFFVPFVNMVTTEENRNKRHKEEMNCDNDRRMVVICKLSYERKFHYCLPQHLK